MGGSGSVGKHVIFYITIRPPSVLLPSTLAVTPFSLSARALSFAPFVLPLKNSPNPSSFLTCEVGQVAVGLGELALAETKPAPHEPLIYA